MKIIMTSTNNFGNSFGNFSENLRREYADFTAYEPLVNGYNFANKHDTFSQQAGEFLFRTFDKVVASLGGRIALRSDGNQDGIFARAIKRVGGNNQSWSLLQRTEIGERKWDKNNIATLIAGHISNLVRYSRIQMTAPQVSEAREYQNQDRSISAVAQANAVGLRVLTSLLRAQFGPRSYFAYADSIP